MHKIQKIWPYLVVSILFWFVRIPYLLFNSFPRFDGDSFDYYKLAFEIDGGGFPDFSVIPPAYSLFLYFVSALNIDTYGIVLIQIFLSFFGYLFLFHQLKKFKNLNVWFSIITLFIISTTSFNLQLETSIITEPLYKPLLLILTGVLVGFYHSPHKKVFYFLIPFLAVLGALIRSNGMYLYYLVIAFCVYLFLFKRKTHSRRILLCLVTFIGLNSIWSLSNYISYDTFLFGNTYRIKIILNNVKDGTRNNYNGLVRDNWQDNNDDGTWIYSYSDKINHVKELQVKNIKSKPKMFLNYMWSFCVSDIPFYQEIIQERFDNSFSNGQLTYNFNDNPINKYCLKNKDCREYAIKEINSSDYTLHTPTFWSIISDKIMSFNKLIFHNFVLLILFYVISIFEFIRLLRNYRNPLKGNLLSLCVISMYILNLGVVAITHNRLCARYEQVNQFMILITLFLFIVLNKESLRSWFKKTKV